MKTRKTDKTLFHLFTLALIVVKSNQRCLHLLSFVAKKTFLLILVGVECCGVVEYINVRNRNICQTVISLNNNILVINLHHDKITYL